MMLELKGKGYYQHSFTTEDHKRLRDMLKRIAGKVIISYDNHPEIRRLYKGFNIRETDPVPYTINNRPGSTEKRSGELLITNF
jgi:DNA adenine methylase